MKYECWLNPTEKGVKAFGWEPKLLETFDKKQDAQDYCYAMDSDESSQDFRHYARYEVKEIPV